MHTARQDSVVINRDLHTRRVLRHARYRRFM